MTDNPFSKATRSAARLRLSIIGPSGSGKTYSALGIAEGLGSKVAVIDTEHGTASKYADRFQFDVFELASFEPARFIQAIALAEEHGYDVIVIDSLSHAWAGKGGILEMVDQIRGTNERAGFSAWGKATPVQNRLVESILSSRCHIIATIRSKQGHIQEVGADGRTTIKKVGLQPVQRDDLEYEFDIVGEMDSAVLRVTKTRYDRFQGIVIEHPGRAWGEELRAEIGAGEPLRERPKQQPAPAGQTGSDGSAGAKPPPPNSTPTSAPVEGAANWPAFWKVLARAKGGTWGLERFKAETGNADAHQWKEADRARYLATLGNAAQSSEPPASGIVPRGTPHWSDSEPWGQQLFELFEPLKLTEGRFSGLFNIEVTQHNFVRLVNEWLAANPGRDVAIMAAMATPVAQGAAR